MTQLGLSILSATFHVVPPSHPRSSPKQEGLADPLLPPGLVWAIAPVGLALVVAHGGLLLSIPELLRRIAAQYVPFAVYGVAFHLASASVMPELLTRMPSRGGQLALHVLAVCVIPPPLAVIVHPLLQAAEGLSVPFWRFVLTSIAVSGVCILPAVIAR